MKKLKSLNILGKKTKVVYKNLDPFAICGRFIIADDLIEVNTKCNAETQAITIIHELCHATLFRSGIPNTNLNEEVEEIICDQIAKTIVENFKLIPK